MVLLLKDPWWLVWLERGSHLARPKTVNIWVEVERESRVGFGINVFLFSRRNTDTSSMVMKSDRSAQT